MTAVALVEEAFDRNILSRDVHGPLLRSASKITQDAAIPEFMLYKSMTEFCTPTDLDYIRGLRQWSARSVCGYAVTPSKGSMPVMDRMMAMAAACLRNYISARVMTLSEVQAAIKKDDLGASVVFVPNFFTGKGDGGVIPEWEIAPLLGWLYRRQAQDLQTVVYVQSIEAMEQAYGSSIARLMRTHYRPYRA